MKTITRYFACLLIFTAMTIGGARMGHGQLSTGQQAPPFSLKDSAGKVHDLSQMKERSLIILYFFDADSRPSQEGLLSLNQLAKKHKDADLAVLAVTLSTPDKVQQFLTRSGLTFPTMLDTSGVSDLYGARLVLPTVCTIGPDLKVLDYFQGGGKTTQVMLARLAERQLQRRQTALAKAISEEVVKKNPDNLQAKTVKGYAALREGDLLEAETVFKDLSNSKGEDEVVGKEGLAAVYARQGQAGKALQLAEEVEQKAPQRAYVNVIKGDVLYTQGKKQEAEAEYRKSIQKKSAEPYNKAVGYNQLGRVYANLGKYDQARGLYDQAVAIDPYYVEGTTNKGRTYEKEGKWDKALESYRQALAIEKKDTIAAVLAKNAQDMLELQQSTERKQRMDRLVKDLAARYRSQEKSLQKEDTWTSRPMILSFVDFQEKGGLSQRDGLTTVLTTQLADHLNASGRVQVVERVLVESLLEELNLGSSELADPETALRLGKVLAAKVIGTGSVYYLPNSTLLTFRLIDTETSAIPMVTNKPLASQVSLEKDLFALNREILQTVITKYPLQGYLVQVMDDRVLVNLGSNQGVVLGTKFEVLDEQEPIKYKGKMLQIAPKPVGELEVFQIEPDLCYARILAKERSLKSDDKVREKIDQSSSGAPNAS